MDFQYAFLDPSLPLKKRVGDLVSRLTVEEKAGFIPTKNQAVQRLGVPAWSIGGEGAHGFVDREGQNTAFPQTIGLAAGWDRELLRKIGGACAAEARVYYYAHERKGGLSLWAPTIDMERDPRWGRTEEGYGEDPFLAGELSSAYIRGAQGDDPFYLRISCGPKHFFANNNEKNRAACSCSIPARVMHEYYLAPFRKAVRQAGAASTMTAYNEVNGIPMMLHPMLNELVKDQWGLEGHLVTDGGDFLQTVDEHHYFESHAETLAAALKNGADSMTDSPEAVIAAVMEALERKLIDEAELDRHLERILAVRFRLGHFDPPGLCPYDAEPPKDARRQTAELAREAVRKSAVLLKNEGHLPLRPGSFEGPVAVLGPLADTVYLDWYSGHPAYACTPLDGLRELYGEGRIIHADCRDIVSFAAGDGRPLVLEEAGAPAAGKILAAGLPGQAPARFYLEDWGWGAFTLADADPGAGETGLFLEAPFSWQEQGAGADGAQNFVSASAKSSLNWLVTTLFNIIPQENGLVLLRTWDNRRVAAPNSPGPVLLRNDPAGGCGELFRMKKERDGLAAAEETVVKAGQVVFIGGSNPMINGREEVDRPSLNLPPRQEELLRRISAANPKTALVMVSGYPFTCKEIAKLVPSVLWMAHGLQETGRGLADIIGGRCSPAGRLPLSWYEDEGQLPSIMEYDIISAASTYQYFKGPVLWPFGYGLSYSAFAYSDLAIDRAKAEENDTVAVSFKIKNTGSMEADEVPQMYAAVSGSVFRRPLKSLKGFERVCLKPGEERAVAFSLPVRELAAWDSYNGRFCVEQGYCSVMIGASSADIRLSGGFEVTGESPLPRKISSPVYAERFDDYSNCYLHEKRGSGIPAVFNREGGGWIRFAALDFAGGAGRFSVIAQGGPGSRVEIRLDSPDGAKAGAAEVPNTGEICSCPLKPDSPRRRPSWAFAETATEKISGVHDLYLVMYGKTGIWRFEFSGIE